MFCCKKCGALIDLGLTEEDCPRGCFDFEKEAEGVFLTEDDEEEFESEK